VGNSEKRLRAVKGNDAKHEPDCQGSNICIGVAGVLQWVQVHPQREKSKFCGLNLGDVVSAPPMAPGGRELTSYYRVAEGAVFN